MRKHTVLLLVAALAVALTASTAVAAPGKGKGKGIGKPKIVTYVFKGTVAETPAGDATSLLVDVTDGNKAGRTVAGESQMSFGVLSDSSKAATKIELDELRVPLSDFRAGDEVVVQSKAVAGTTAFNARVISADSPDVEPYFLDGDGDGVGEGDAEKFAPNRVPEGYVSQGGDNCEGVSNPDQADADGNGVGDACEPTLDPVV